MLDNLHPDFDLPVSTPYTSLKGLTLAVMALSETDVEALKYLGVLVNVYFDALHNPPLGIIGVGAITYAESVLVAYQLERIL